MTDSLTRYECDACGYAVVLSDLIPMMGDEHWCRCCVDREQVNAAKAKLVRKLADKEYRDGFVAELIQTGLPFQIRALRDDREWTQRDLAEKAGMKQSRISQVENPNYGKLTLHTLLRLASAFDVGLEVRFVSFSDLVDRSTSRSDYHFEQEYEPLTMFGGSVVIDPTMRADEIVLRSGESEARLKVKGGTTAD